MCQSLLSTTMSLMEIKGVKTKFRPPFKYVNLRKIQMEAEKLKNYVNGKWVDSKTGSFFPIVNSLNGQTIALCPDSTINEVDLTISLAKKAFQSWRNTIPTRRADILYTLREKLLAATNELAEIITLEHGKTLSDAKGELMRAIQYCGTSLRYSGTVKGRSQ